MITPVHKLIGKALCQEDMELARLDLLLTWSTHTRTSSTRTNCTSILHTTHLLERVALPHPVHTDPGRLCVITIRIQIRDMDPTPMISITGSKWAVAVTATRHQRWIRAAYPPLPCTTSFRAAGKGRIQSHHCGRHLDLMCRTRIGMAMDPPSSTIA
ncbi:hypothetical protein BC828DRAFT_377503 [Blastocladiella britannica]|nr:hypothetical protein BC828DRAFT_377503 [Blastocladiella britannica]